MNHWVNPRFEERRRSPSPCEGRFVGRAQHLWSTNQ
jgi:hypothetical protein